ncbi:SGNH hydrolase-type esterase domain-containing protein [Usnea florida]
MNPPTAMPPSIRILCFGASITAGWSQLGQRYHPYANALEAHLKTALPTTHFSVQTDGLPGDTVVQGQYLKRLRSLTRSATTPYDIIIIQGGGNDLLSCQEPEDILHALQEIWDMALTSGSRTIVVALTVTNTVGASEVLARRYDALNELIGREERHERLYSVDVAKLLPPATVENVLVGKVYDRDGVHLGKKGYEMMGEAIGASLVEIIRAGANGERSSECTERSNVHHFSASNSKSHPR